MEYKRKPFQGTLCYALAPGTPPNAMTVRDSHCMRAKNHCGPHRSWLLEWDEGYDEAHLRNRENEKR